VLTLAFSGLKGIKGDTGVSADYPITLYNGLDSDATDQALTAAQGKVLDGKIGQLRQEVNDLDNAVMKVSSVENTYQFSDIGGRYQANGVYVSDVGSHRGVVIIPVVSNASYKITTYLRSAQIPGVIYTSDESVIAGQRLTAVLGTEYPGTGSEQTISEQPLTIPAGTTFIVAQTANILALPQNSGVLETASGLESNVYTKAEADEKFAPITSFANKVYGVKWDTTDPDDLGERCFDAVGMTAQIGIGTTDGHSDFDNILPWSGMKRCNIKANANGAKIVTFEGETGFALDGSNGDVFVRIPKFYSERYTENGEEYIVISSVGNTVHPAFIEDGKELNEIFVAAFEGRIVDGKLSSRSGVIPSNNETGQTFLDAAKANGDQYTLYDMRAVDALWRLMAVEYGCRNSNHIIGWGYADFQQPIDNAAYRVTVDATNTNTVVLGLPIDEAERKKSLSRFSPGNTITICSGSQYNIIAQRVISSVSQASTSDYLTITFEGERVDVSVGMFVGSAPCVTNRCETIDQSVRLSWHTGRANYTPVSAGINNAAINPCRYRWIENIVGSAWHFLPDVTFNGLQMYICPNMKDYEMFKYTPPYMPVGPILTKNTDNGNKADVVNANYWVTKLMNDIFSPAVNFGVSYDKSLTSTKAFGAYYYLYDTRVCIVNGGGFDHLWRCNILTNRAWVNSSDKWYLYGARLMFKNIS
jgi:hypothetical protein